MTKILSSTDKELEELNYLATRLEQLHRGKQFHAKQQEVIRAIFEQGYKRIFIRKGRKGGGTETILYPVTRIAGCFNNMATYIIEPTMKLAKEILWENKRLQNFIPKEWSPQFKETEGRCRLPNGSYIKVEGADNWNSMVGFEGDVFVFDELRNHDPRAYKNCYPNIASRDAIWIVCGAPPANKDNFYHQLEEEIRQDPDWYFLHWTTWDNPFLPGGREWLEKEKERYYRAGNWDEWEREYEARYVFGGKRTVLSNLNQRHRAPFDVIEAMISKDKGKLQWYQIFDPGYATCFSILFICYNPYTSQVFLLDEIYETNRSCLSINSIWPRVQQKERELFDHGKWQRIYDCAAPGFPQEVRSRWGSGYTFRPCVKHKDDEDKYFRVWNALLASEGSFFVAEDRCPSTLWEMENYLTDEDGRYPDKNNHSLDNFRYFLKHSNFSPLEKQDDVRRVEPARMISMQEDIEEQRKKDDWASSAFDDFDFEIN